MRKPISVLASMATGLLAACALAMAVPLTPDTHGLESAEAASACGASWSTVPSAPKLQDPRAITPISSNDIWIVGSRALNDSGDPTTGV